MGIPDDPIIRAIEETGYPRWAQEMIEDFDEPEEEDELPEMYMAVLNAIGYGKQKAVTRRQLAEKTGLEDRAVRKAIQTLRRTYIILNDQDGKGYYRSYDPQQIRRAYRTERARAISILYRLEPMRALLRGGGLL